MNDIYLRGETSNPNLAAVENNLNNFIENINCLRETYGYSEGMLNQQFQTACKQYEDFISLLETTEQGDSYVIPADKLKAFNKVHKRKERAKMAFFLIPPSYIVSLVSIFDSFYAGLVRCVYMLKPDMLQESGKTFCYRDLKELDSIKEVKK
ncbi:MAG: hypothetical protein IKP54_07425 [Bacteroidales bacterium]|nr:hypothetical protein [Bacteroidales bacterium]